MLADSSFEGGKKLLRTIKILPIVSNLRHHQTLLILPLNTLYSTQTINVLCFHTKLLHYTTLLTIKKLPPPLITHPKSTHWRIKNYQTRLHQSNRSKINHPIKNLVIKYCSQKITVQYK